MYEISIIGASDSRDTYEDISKYHIFFNEDAKCRTLRMDFEDGESIIIYLGINDRVEVEKV